MHFEDLGGGVLRDSRTGLEWTERDNGSDIGWNGASAYCSASTLGGKTDWRTATIDELAALYGEDLPQQSCGRFTCRIYPEFELTGAAVWSSTKNRSAEDHLLFRFNHGDRFLFTGFTIGRVLCVRRSEGDPRGLRTSTSAAEQMTEPLRKTVEASGPSFGPAIAPVTIIEFASFACPFSARVRPAIEKVKETYGDQVRLVFRQFPLALFPNSLKAAEASLCAHDQGKFWEMHDAMFGDNKNLRIAGLKRKAEAIEGVNAEQFGECLDSGKYEEQVQADLADGSAARVSGTPTFFINGRLLSGAQPYEGFANVIDEELKAGRVQELAVSEAPLAQPEGDDPASAQTIHPDSLLHLVEEIIRPLNLEDLRQLALELQQATHFSHRSNSVFTTKQGAEITVRLQGLGNGQGEAFLNIFNWRGQVIEPASEEHERRIRVSFLQLKEPQEPKTADNAVGFASVYIEYTGTSDAARNELNGTYKFAGSVWNKSTPPEAE